jgi:hypothetical protein
MMTGDRQAYAAGVGREDRLLEQRLADIRRREDEGTITVRLAADARIDAMERHLDALARLRELYLGDEGDGS